MSLFQACAQMRAGAFKCKCAADESNANAFESNATNANVFTILNTNVIL